MLDINRFIFLFGLPILSHQTVILKIGVISGICSKTGYYIGKNTSVTYKSPTDDLSAEIYWKFVNISEEFYLYHAVTELTQLDLDCIVIAANIRLSSPIENLIKVPIIDWGKDKFANLSKPVKIPDGCPMTSTVATSTRSGCITPTGNYLYQEPVLQNLTGAAITLISVIVHLKWSSVCIIFDNETEKDAMMMHYGLSATGIFAIMHRMEDMTSLQIDALKDSNISIHDQISLNFTVLCRLESCRRFLKKPFDYGRKHIWRSSLLHYSRWLVSVFHDGSISVLEDNSTDLDNVAIIQYPVSLIDIPKQNDMNLEDAVKSVFYNVNNMNRSDVNALTTAAIDGLNFLDYDQLEDCSWIPIQTLMWDKTRRRLNKVGHVQLTGSLLTEKEIFPNAKFGFNRRKFIVSTLPWHPFVYMENKTGKYTGFTMDLLQEVAHGLNFTYEITTPPDSKWGVADNNNTWNGLVGVLQRREVDIVAAPLTMEGNRETVMDFTHPYFYEFTGILLKKPDPNAKKWSTLIDPFRPEVLLCIFISLPVSSFFLFFFEKYNPYYRKVEDRRKVRGLHHFSDSFWYMYGALLTQGGEHMADSSSGRTLLSFWWIFCIIMMATYSGNLIAFLTVTKDKLPFKDLEGLVTQDTYKWGTLGGTSFETMMKNSKLADRQRFWEGIIKYNRTDPTVLSDDFKVQKAKVMEGDYAYVGDKTPMELAMVNNCDLAMASAEILPIQYAMGLPNNSPFTKMFSDEIIAIHESGLLQIWKLRHWPNPGFCKGSLLTEAKPITLIDIHSAFYIIAIGIFIASVSLLGEYLKNRYYRWREKRGKVKEKTESIKHVNTIPKMDEML